MSRDVLGNIRLRNPSAPGTEGGVTRCLPDREQTTTMKRRCVTRPAASRCWSPAERTCAAHKYHALLPALRPAAVRASTWPRLS